MNAIQVGWWDVPNLWKTATRVEKASAVIPPLLVPASLFLSHAFLPLGLALYALVFCAVAFMVRLCLQPFRRNKPNKLKAWRLPLSGMLAAIVLIYVKVSMAQASVQLRDIMIGMRTAQNDGLSLSTWPCGSERRCRIKVGIAPVFYNATLSRESAPDGSILLTAEYMQNIDHWIVFELDENGAVEARTEGDNGTRKLDIDTLTALTTD